GWQANARVDYTGPMAQGNLATNPPAYFLARSGDFSLVSYESQLRSAELTLWRRWNSRVRLGAGFRWIEFNDRLSSNTLFVRDPVSVPAMIYFNANNDMYGFQLAGEVLLYSHNRLRIEAVGKAGIYGLAANEASALDQSVVEVHARAFDSAGAASFAGELDFLGTFELNRHWSIICGCQLLWLEGIALASDQIDNTGSLNYPLSDPIIASTTLDSGGGIFAHGATVAMEFRW
ncbi:MAG: BBP7 family outer membrane beta-barrel protein, partial [Thermoguttaceae bacterium]